LSRLLATLHHQDDSAILVVHHDQFRCDLDKKHLDGAGEVTLITSNHPIVWGEFSQVEAHWRMLAWTIEHVEFDWAVLLSGQDYPIKPLQCFYEMLSQVDGNALIESRPVADIEKPTERADARFRYYYQYAKPIDLGIRRHLSPALCEGLGRASKFFADSVNYAQPLVHVYKLPDPLPNRIGIRALSNPFHPAAMCWKGSSWSTLNRRAVESVLRVATQDDGLAQYYRRTVLPDESITATIIGGDSELRIVRQGFQHIRWHDGENGHPDVFRESDFDELLRSNLPFARKFDVSVDSLILDRVDDLISQK